MDDIKRIIDLQITKYAPSTLAESFDTALLLTVDGFLDINPIGKREKKVLTFTDLGACEDYFGLHDMRTFTAASAYFSQESNAVYKPKKLLIATNYAFKDQYGVTVIDSINDISKWKEKNNASFSVTINWSGVNNVNETSNLQLLPMDFSKVKNMHDVALIIGQAIMAKCALSGIITPENFTASDHCAFRNGVIMIQNITTEAPVVNKLSSGSTYQSLENVIDFDNTKAVKGSSKLTEEETFLNIKELNWAVLLLCYVSQLNDMNILGYAGLIETERKMMFINRYDDDIFKQEGNNSITEQMKLKGKMGLSKTVNLALNCDFNSEYFTFLHYFKYPEISWVGQQIAKPIGSTNWAFKELVNNGGMYDYQTNTETTDQKNNCINENNSNVYIHVKGRNIVYPGQTVGGRGLERKGEWIDVIRNIDFVAARCEEGLFSLFVDNDIIPYTQAGIDMIEAAQLSLLQTYGIDTGIFDETSVKTNFPKIEDTTQNERDNRNLPVGHWEARLNGALNHITIRATVYA